MNRYSRLLAHRLQQTGITKVTEIVPDHTNRPLATLEGRELFGAPPCQSFRICTTAVAGTPGSQVSSCCLFRDRTNQWVQPVAAHHKITLPCCRVAVALR